MKLTLQQVESFQATVWDYYAKHRRELPWRMPEVDGSFDPYKILVSEIMLQQTQVNRVVPKYHLFLEKFPEVKVLANAQLGEVLTVWSGLGYNRRAKFLHQAAQNITKDHNGSFPKTLNALTKLPGVGKNTAGAVLVYAYNQPLPFIETNIRTVFINHFFNDHADLITDQQIFGLLQQAIDQENPREFYWALMDYGTHIKATQGNLNKLSKSYSKQSSFEGSLRQIR